MKKLPISAFVVVFNEARYLEKCLSGLSFCDEVVVVDLGSKDKSLEIAEKCGAKIFHHEKVPFAEYIQAKVRNYVRNEWVLITDPDEVISEKLVNSIDSHFLTWIKNLKVGALRVPMKYYVGKKSLKGTVWGETNRRTYIVHLDKFSFKPKVHSGRTLLPGFKELSLQSEAGYIHHYWVDSFKELVHKFKGYLKFEGQARFENNKIASLSSILKSPFTIFYVSYFQLKGFKDGFLGFRLSLFYAIYQTMAKVESRKFVRKSKKS